MMENMKLLDINQVSEFFLCFGSADWKCFIFPGEETKDQQTTVAMVG